MNKKQSDTSALTAQLVSQLMYCSSRLQYEDFNQIRTEILNLTEKYNKRIKKLQGS